MKRVFRVKREGKVKEVGLRSLATGPEADSLDSKVALIQALIPLGLEAVRKALEDEITALAGKPHSRTGRQPGMVRWSRERGSVYQADQKLPILYTRVRNRIRNTEVPLLTYQKFQQPREADAGLFRKVLLGLSCQRYDLVALFLDGKTFAQDEIVIAVGITLKGEKVILGFVQTATENEAVCAAFLRELVERGLRFEDGLLVVLDGAKGLRKAVHTVFGAQAVVHRCQWHKRENVVRYLPKGQRAPWRRKLQAAYEKPTYAEAKAALLRSRKELALLNQSAAKSLEEGLEETLTLHRLGVFGSLGESLKTTNCLESIMAQVGRRTDRVDRWRTSDQKHRWVALLDIEPRLRRIKGYRHLPLLQAALKRESLAKREIQEDVA